MNYAAIGTGIALVLVTTALGVIFYTALRAVHEIGERIDRDGRSY